MGDEEHLLELKAAFEKVYKLKGAVLGPEEGDSKEGVHLGKRIHWCGWGIQLEVTPSTSRSCSRPQEWSLAEQ